MMNMMTGKLKMEIKELTKKEYEKKLDTLIKDCSNAFKVSEDEIKEFVKQRNELIDKYDKEMPNSERILSLFVSIRIKFEKVEFKNNDVSNKVENFEDDDYDDW